MRRRVLALVLMTIFVTVSLMGFAQTKGEKSERAKDPVCGIMVEKDPALSTTYKGETYYFCSKVDMEKFKKTPEKYLGKK